MNEPILIPEAEGKRPARILCVDDEPNILTALRRLFRPLGYEILVAEGGESGLQILESTPVDIVISDMRMPGMDGTQFLECVRIRWPDTIRLLLTGYADVRSILGAINRGEIYRYITKPWDDNDIVLVVRHALERKSLEAEKQRLEALTYEQNEELKALNANLENKVAARTAELRKVHDELLVSNERLKENYLTSIKVFSSMIEMRGANLAGHSRRVADLSRRIATRMNLDSLETQHIFIAGLLHNIGKIGFSDDLLSLPMSLMNGEQLGQYWKYPIRGEQLLTPLEDLREAAKIVRSHQERFDGEGYPDRLSGFDIPLGARVLAVASDYDNLQIGALAQRRLRPDEAVTAIVNSRGKRYDPLVVAVFQDTILGRNVVEPPPGEALPVSALRPGMTLARDLVTRDGFLLLSAEHTLSERLIRQIVDFEHSSNESFTVYVLVEQKK
ncbi:MAG TPA: HD domain-containing phosphohydrolase [Burkholderiaceae bacterium]|nr:HD domain-containing phosphohydrolase [Burkholderiaceae bacterium]